MTISFDEFFPRGVHGHDLSGREPDATVIIPTRGNEPFLGEILSALDRFPGIEVLVIDDPETPSNVGAVVNSTVWHRVHYVEQDSREGKAGAMNQGVRLARSDVLVFMDADAVPEPGLLREALWLLRQRPGCDVVSVHRRHETIGWAILTEPFLASVGFVTPWCCAMRKHTLVKYGGFKRDYLEDVEFWIRTRDNGCRIRWTQNKVVLKRRVRKEFLKFFHTLRHMMRSPHTH